MLFKKVTFTVPLDGGFTLTGTDYIADEHLIAFVSHQGTIGHPVVRIENDDRPEGADRSYNPPAHITGASA